MPNGLLRLISPIVFRSDENLASFSPGLPPFPFQSMLQLNGRFLRLLQQSVFVSISEMTWPNAPYFLFSVQKCHGADAGCRIADIKADSIFPSASSFVGISFVLIFAYRVSPINPKIHRFCPLLNKRGDVAHFSILCPFILIMMSPDSIPACSPGDFFPSFVITW